MNSEINSPYIADLQRRRGKIKNIYHCMGDIFFLEHMLAIDMPMPNTSAQSVQSRLCLNVFDVFVCSSLSMAAIKR